MDGRWKMMGRIRTDGFFWWATLDAPKPDTDGQEVTLADVDGPVEPHEAQALLAQLAGHGGYSRAHAALGRYKLEAIADDGGPMVIGNRVITVPSPPAPHVLELARQIRVKFGGGGARFPGSRELYAAAEAIEAWAGEWPEYFGKSDATETQGAPDAA